MTAKFSRLAVLCGVALPLGFACGGDDGPTYIPRPDGPPPDAMEPCKAADMYNPMGFGSDVQSAEDFPRTGSGEEMTLHNIFFTAPLDDADPGDYLYIDLYEMYGAFAGGDIMPGSYGITEDDMAYSSCGMCIMVSGDEGPNGVDDWYMANSGTVNLTSVTDRLIGNLSNVVLFRVKHDSEGNPSDTPTYDCMTKIVSASFNVEITPGMTMMAR